MPLAKQTRNVQFFGNGPTDFNYISFTYRDSECKFSWSINPKGNGLFYSIRRLCDV
jgi:hypothetical protein